VLVVVLGVRTGEAGGELVYPHGAARAHGASSPDTSGHGEGEHGDSDDD